MNIRSTIRWTLAMLIACTALIFTLTTLNHASAQSESQNKSTLSSLRYVATSGVDASNDCTDNTNPCATVQHTVDVADENNEIRVATGTYTDVQSRNSMTQVVYISKTLTLRGGYTTTDWIVSNPISNPTVLDGQGQNRIVYIDGAITSTLDGLHIVNGGNGYTWNSGAINAPSGTLILMNSSVINNFYLAALAKDATLINSQFISNTGGGLYTRHSLFALDSTFINNDGQGSVSVDGPATIINSRFENNPACCLMSLNVDGGDLTLSNTSFIGNLSGAVHMIGGSIAVYGGRFERNGDGALFNQDGFIAITNAVFISNTAGEPWGFQGGAVTAYSAQIVGSRFENNIGGGGALYVQISSITGTEFISNSGGNGGAVYSAYTAITNSVFLSNSSDYGGGVAGGGSIVGSRFENNRAIYGGGAHLGIPSFISDTQFIGNSALDTGGAVFLFYIYLGSDVSIVNTRFTQNTAGDSGAALGLMNIPADQPANARLQHITIADVGLNPKSAIWVSTGTLGITNSIIANHAIAIDNAGATVYEDYNLFYGNFTNTVGSVVHGGHSLIGDPKFVDPVNGDYHLSPNSAAIDHGVDVGINTDLDSNPRDSRPDMGAYEFSWPYRWYFPIIYKQ